MAQKTLNNLIIASKAFIVTSFGITFSYYLANIVTFFLKASCLNLFGVFLFLVFQSPIIILLGLYLKTKIINPISYYLIFFFTCFFSSGVLLLTLYKLALKLGMLFIILNLANLIIIWLGLSIFYTIINIALSRVILNENLILKNIYLRLFGNSFSLISMVLLCIYIYCEFTSTCYVLVQAS